MKTVNLTTVKTILEEPIIVYLRRAPGSPWQGGRSPGPASPRLVTSESSVKYHPFGPSTRRSGLLPV
jgi:hypothetical protein